MCFGVDGYSQGAVIRQCQLTAQCLPFLVFLFLWSFVDIKQQVSISLRMTKRHRNVIAWCVALSVVLMQLSDRANSVTVLCAGNLFFLHYLILLIWKEHLIVRRFLTEQNPSHFETSFFLLLNFSTTLKTLDGTKINLHHHKKKKNMYKILYSKCSFFFLFFEPSCCLSWLGHFSFKGMLKTGHEKLVFSYCESCWLSMSCTLRMNRPAIILINKS